MLTLSSATASDLGTRIRRALHGGAGPMGTLSRGIAAVLICGLGAITLPSASDAQRTRDAGETKERSREDGIDWDVVKSTSPADWSDALKAQIVAAGHDVEAIAERVRQGQAEATRDKEKPDLEEIGQRIRAAVESGDLTPEEGRERLEAARRSAGDKGGDDKLNKGGDDKLQDSDAVDWRAAMAVDPEDWPDELEAQIVAAGYDLEEVKAGIKQRQEFIERRSRIRAAVESGDLTPEEGRERLEAARRSAGDKGGDDKLNKGGDDKLQDSDAVDWRAAMAVDPEDWPDELEAQIVAAGYDLEEVRAGIKQRQEAAIAGDRRTQNDTDSAPVLQSAASGTKSINQESSGDDNIGSTAIEQTSWGQIKAESGKNKQQ